MKFSIHLNRRVFFLMKMAENVRKAYSPLNIIINISIKHFFVFFHFVRTDLAILATVIPPQSDHSLCWASYGELRIFQVES